MLIQKRLLLLGLIILIFSVIAGAAYGAPDGRKLVDNLYASPGHLPINDMVIDMEFYTPIGEKGKGSSMQLLFKDKVMFKKPNKLRIESRIVDPGSAMDGKVRTIIRDGSHRWMYISAGQFPVKKGSDEASPTLVLPPNIQVYPQDTNNEYTVLGVQKVGDVNATLVQIDNKGRGEVTKIWIDTQHWVPVRLEKTIPHPKGKEPVVKICRYQKFTQLKDGRWFPFVIEISVNDKVDSLLVYKAVSVNVGIKDEIFAPMEKYIR